MARSRGPMRAVAVALALARWGVRRERPRAPRRILVLHHLLFGDTLMLTALLAKLRDRYPDAEIVMTVDRPFAPLYAGRPYGVRAHAFDARDLSTFWPLLRGPRFDLVILPADNRWSWLARAIGARWITGIAGDRPAHKNWPVDHLVPYSDRPMTFGETAASLVEGPATRTYAPADWPAPVDAGRARVAGDYAVLHVGASTSLKLWEPARCARWPNGSNCAASSPYGRSVRARRRCSTPLTAPRDTRDSPARLRSKNCGIWLTRARLLVAPDTGVAHSWPRSSACSTVGRRSRPGSAVALRRGRVLCDAPLTVR